MTTAKEAKPMWLYYQVTLQFDGPFASAIPKDPHEIRAMLEHRMPANPPAGATPIDELAEQVAQEVQADEVPQPGWSTFKQDENGLYYEGRCVRGHLKDVALQVASFMTETKAGKTEVVKNFRSKFVNKTYVVTNKIPLGKKEPDGNEQRFIQVMTRQGPRSSFKFIDFVDSPRMTFVLKVLNDGVIREEHLRTIFEYGGTHGMGQERSQDWGRYALVDLKQVNRDG